MFPPDTRILVIDDLQSMRDIVKATLKTLGYKNVQEAVDGSDGLRMLTGNIPTPDLQFQLVISDWNMPNMKGIDLLKKVRATPELKHLPFVLITAESDRTQVVEAASAGVSQYLVKPFTAKTLEEKLQTTYAKHFKG